MKLFLLNLGVILCVFFTPSFSQDSVVCIKPSTARYYLEIQDEAYILREKDSISNQVILTMSESLLVKDQIIETYENDSATHAVREEALTSHIEFQGQVIDQQNKEIKKQKLTKWGVIMLGVVALLLL